MDFKNKYQEEIDYKQVLSKPIRWFGLVYPYFFIVILIIGLFYISSLNTLSENDIPAMIIDSTVFKEKIPKKAASVMQGVKIEEVKVPDQKYVTRGAEIFKSNCASCHGEDGKGDGPAGAALNPPPRNFTSTDGWVNGRKISQMYKTLEEGITGSGMAAYDYMPPLDKFSVIHYIRQTFMKSPPKDSDEELTQLDQTYQLSEGRENPPTIPVELAMNKLVGDAKTDSAIASEMAVINPEIIDTDINSYHLKNGEEIFNNIAKNKFVIHDFLDRHQEWKDSMAYFIDLTSNTAGENGFSEALLRLNGPQWQDLYLFLRETH